MNKYEINEQIERNTRRIEELNTSPLRFFYKDAIDDLVAKNESLQMDLDDFREEEYESKYYSEDEEESEDEELREDDPTGILARTIFNNRRQDFLQRNRYNNFFVSNDINNSDNAVIIPRVDEQKDIATSPLGIKKKAILRKENDNKESFIDPKLSYNGRLERDPVEEKYIEQILESNRQSLQSKFTELLYSFEDKSEPNNPKKIRNINDILQLTGEVMWKLTCIIFYDFKIPNGSDKGMSYWYNYFFGDGSKKQDIIDKWTNEIRFYLKGGKALRKFKEKLNEDQQTKVNELKLSDSDWDFNLVIPDEKFNYEDLIIKVFSKDEELQENASYNFERQEKIYRVFINICFKLCCKLIDNFYNGRKILASINTVNEIYNYIFSTDKYDIVSNVFTEQFQISEDDFNYFFGNEDERNEYLSLILEVLKRYEIEIKLKYGDEKFSTFFDNYFKLLMSDKVKSEINQIIDTAYPDVMVDRIQSYYRTTTFNDNSSNYLKNLGWYLNNLKQFFNNKENRKYMRLKYTVVLLPDGKVKLARMNCFFNMVLYQSDKLKEKYDIKVDNKYFKNFQRFVFTSIAEMIDVGSSVNYIYNKRKDEYLLNESYIKELEESDFYKFIRPINPTYDQGIPIPRLDYHLEDNLNIIAEDKGKKIQKRCSRFNSILEFLCMSENVEYVQNNPIIFGEASLINASQEVKNNAPTDCFKSITKVFELASNIKISVNENNNIKTQSFQIINKNDIARILLLVRNYLNETPLRIKSIEFKFNTIKFLSTYENFCKVKGMEFNGSAKSKVDVIMSIVNRINRNTPKYMTLEEKNNIIHFLLNYSKVDVEKIASDFITNFNENTKTLLIKHFEKYVDDLYDDFKYNANVLAPYTLTQTFSDYLEKNMSPAEERKLNSPSPIYNEIFMDIDDIKPETNKDAEIKLFKILKGVMYNYIIPSINLSYKGDYKVVIGGGSAFEFYIDTTENDMKIFETSDFDLRVVAIKNINKILSTYNEKEELKARMEIYKAKQDIINKIVIMLNDLFNTPNFLENVEAKTGMKFEKVNDLIFYQAISKVFIQEYSKDNTIKYKIDDYNSYQVISEAFNAEDFVNPNIVSFLRYTSNCLYNYKFGENSYQSSLVDLVAYTQYRLLHYKESKINDINIMDLTPLNQDIIYNGLMEINNRDKMATYNGLFPYILSDTQETIKEINVDLYVINLGYLVWDSIRMVRWATNEVKTFYYNYKASHNRQAPPDNDIVQELIKQKYNRYIEKYFKLLQALNSPEKYLNCESMKELIKHCSVF